MMAYFTLTTIAAFGLIIGSFLTVCIYRIPLGREKGLLEGAELVSDESDVAEPPEQQSSSKLTISNPKRSFCPSCNHQLAWWCNVPFFSWLFLRGKCHYCGVNIPFRYPLVEILSASFAVVSYLLYGLTPTGILIYVFAATLIVISFIDIDYYIIPNVISLPGTLIAILIAGINQFTGWFQAPVVPDLKAAGLGILAGAGFLFFISEVYLRLRKKEGLGMGDVKLLAMTGALFGVQGSLSTIFVG
ncbi:MAG: prepilin peptidase, partial [Bdellovibrionales bacterium]|nr:prepilin peptidase [Bdellovibrionales bacterium]